MATAVPLSTIVALAGAGTLDHAWAQVCAAGYDRNDDDPAAETVWGGLSEIAMRKTSDERHQ